MDVQDTNGEKSGDVYKRQEYCNHFLKIIQNNLLRYFENRKGML